MTVEQGVRCVELLHDEDTHVIEETTQALVEQMTHASLSVIAEGYQGAPDDQVGSWILETVKGYCSDPFWRRGRLLQALRTCVDEGIEGSQRLYADVSEDLNW